jgi:hypothetical protein
MPNKTLTLALAALPLYLCLTSPAASRQGDVEARQVAKAKSDVARRGVGENAKVTVGLRDKTVIKGYISQVGEDHFVVRDPRTSAETTVAYRDVDKVKGRGLSTAAKIGIGVGIGIAVVVIAIAAAGGPPPVFN